MKFNLKNRPKIHPLPLEQQENLDEYDIGDYPHFYDDSLEWFDGFEKELRERLGKITFKMSVSERVQAYAHLLAEILGETNNEG